MNTCNYHLWLIVILPFVNSMKLTSTTIHYWVKLFSQPANSKSNRNVEINISKNKYIYTIELFQCGNCIEENKIDNWILVPKIPSGYDVDFIFIKK